MRWNTMIFLAGLALVPATARADVRPHALCSEGMVLQQKADVLIWGKADPGEEITVSFRGQKATTKANAEGEWAVTLKSGDAGGPETMIIAGKNTIEYKNVMVGEVWVCSGQSNMEWSVGGCDKGDKDYASSATHNPMLRWFHTRKSPMIRPQTETAGNWVEADPKSVGGWTAVGYFFGRDLQEKLKIPVGLIQSDWGGTRAEAWTSPEALASHPRYKKEIETFIKSTEKAKNPQTSDANAPSALYNGMISPLLKYRIKGAIWYQGESNAGQAYAYRELFPLMIKDWRERWDQRDFPFYFVQLAPFTSVPKFPGESAWAELREAQSMTLKLPNTGMAVIVDYGNEYDIHPTPKRPVGERLALIARARDYGEKVVFSGPVFKEMTVEGNKAVVQFTNIGGGLMSKELVRTLERTEKNGEVRGAWRIKEGSTGAKLIGFTVCGKNRKFFPAEARIQGNTVLVTCEQVPEIAAVRYGWADHPLCNLFNAEGLPASPFRTDDFPGVTQPRGSANRR
jgi:sialate O-acetylesterase